MPKSRSGRLFDYATPPRVTPFLLLNADPSILRYQNPIYSRNKHTMNNFCLWSIFVRSALFSRRLELLCETRTGTHRSGGANLTFVRHLEPIPTYNPIAISRLPLGDYKPQIFSLVRNPVADLPIRPIGGTLFPQPTTHKRAKRASYTLGHNTSSRWRDALPFECVMFSDSVRHQPSSFNSLSYMHTLPHFFEKSTLQYLGVAENDCP
jgi:hypothetical protein